MVGESVPVNGMSRSFGSERLFPMKKTAQHLIAEVPCRWSRVETTIGIDLGDVWSHYCTINQDGKVVDRGRFRTSSKAVEKWFTNLPPARVCDGSGDTFDLDQRAFVLRCHLHDANLRRDNDVRRGDTPPQPDDERAC
jgi:hypothetical protein